MTDKQKNSTDKEAEARREQIIDDFSKSEKGLRKIERKMAIAVFKKSAEQFIKGWAYLIILLPLISLIAGLLVRTCVYLFNFTYNLF